MKPYASLNMKKTLWPYLCLTFVVTGCHQLPEQKKSPGIPANYGSLDCLHLLGEDVKISDRIAALEEEDRLADEAPLPSKSNSSFGQITFSPVKTFGITGSAGETEITQTAPQRSVERGNLQDQLNHLQATERAKGYHVQGQ